MPVKLHKIANIFRVLTLRWRTRHLEITNKNRTELRHQYTEYEGRDILIMDYIRIVAKLMPPMLHNDKPVDHTRALREIYYKYDLKGLKYYIQSINRNMKRTSKFKYIERKLKRRMGDVEKRKITA